MTLFKFKILVFVLITGLISSCSPNNKWTESRNGPVRLLQNQNGPLLGLDTASGVPVLTVDRYAFKDLNRNGKLDPYEDWRLPADERAVDLAGKMSVEQIAGLMLYSGHQAIPSGSGGFGGSTYGGKPFEESGAGPGDLSDQQKDFLKNDNLRHVLITTVESPAVAARWNNHAQALVEGIGLGIPVNTSSDPRHGTASDAEYNAGAGGKISMWPTTLGLAATFDPEIMRRFGEIASTEYRALGIATALSPQIDLPTEPRWSRFSGTMGEDPGLATDLARAYVDGFQTSEGNAVISNGWGYRSVNAMVKHWPGGGPEEGGRDGHFGYGAYAVYPGDNLEDQLRPFTDGAFKLDGPTKTAAAVMPYYTISYNIDEKYGENVGNSFSRYIITDLLRGRYGYDGVVCTDWMITSDVASVHEFQGKSWGVETLGISEKHYKAIEAGVDQFGGNNEMEPVIDAYNMGVKEHGEANMRRQFETSAVRLLKNIFRVGLFENPYLDIKETEETVGKPEFMRAGFEAQLKSVIMLKNRGNTLPKAKELKVYIPEKHIPAGTNWFGVTTPERVEDPFNPDIIKNYYTVVKSPEEADFAIVGIDSPDGGTGYDVNDLDAGGNGYVPISLQYTDYTAEHAREESIAGGSPFEDFTNRSYRGKTVKTSNSNSVEAVKTTRSQMGDRPVIVVINVSKPMVFSEIEQYADAIIIHMGVQDQAVMDIVSGGFEPSGLLPFQMPAGMKTVEEQYEDVPRDMTPYADEAGNLYDFAFGLNWSGVISDERISKYK